METHYLPITTHTADVLAVGDQSRPCDISVTVHSEVSLTLQLTKRNTVPWYNLSSMVVVA